MNVTSAKITKLMFQDKTTGYVSFNLTDQSQLLGIDSYKRVLTYSIIEDFNMISGNSRIFTLQSRTFLSIASGMIRDTSGNAVEVITPDNALALGPSVASWDIDMNTGYISLFFSEDVITPYLKVSDQIFVRLQDSRVTGTNFVNLNTSSRMLRLNNTQYNSSLFVTKLADFDLNYLKYNSVAYSRTTAFLAVSFGLTQSLFFGTIMP
jgi:hypothetical protein